MTLFKWKEFIEIQHGNVGVISLVDTKCLIVDCSNCTILSQNSKPDCLSLMILFGLMRRKQRKKRKKVDDNDTL